MHLFVFYIFISALFISSIFSTPSPEKKKLAITTPKAFIDFHKKAIYTRLKKSIQKADVVFPPHKIRLAVFKKEKKVELWMPNVANQWRFVKEYAFTANSGESGPKLYYGDLQIPEGIYGIDSMALSTEYHLALHVNYPNDFDKAMLALEGRDPHYVSTGINIHGGNISYGCVVVGNTNIEEIFYLTYLAGKNNTELYIFP
ncbi:MAG TPA: hypothetical protein PLY93_08765, partial [Turneriella sp.]|nr:hypothetical protein [Turneriella sp.]